MDIFTEVTGYEAKMWGPSIIGFGKYHYKYQTGHEGDAPLAAYSLAKRKLAYILLQGMNESNYYNNLVNTQQEKPVFILIS